MADGTGTGNKGDDGGIFSTISISDLKKTNKATGDLSDTQRDLVDNANELQKTVDANTDALREYGRGADDAKRKLETLGEAWKRQYDSVVQSTHALVTFNSKIHETGGAITSYLGKMKEAISLGGTYDRLLKELATSQEGYVSSLNFSTASLKTATKEHTSYLKAVNAANISAGATAKQYSLDIKEVRDAHAAVEKTFNTQIIASENQAGAIKSLGEQALVTSKFMGVSLTDAVALMEARLKNSGKTIAEVQTETWKITRAADAYTNSLRKMGKEALRTGQLTRKEYLGAILDVQEAFKQGTHDSGAYAASMNVILKLGRERGLSAAQQLKLVQQYGGVWKKFQTGELSSYFGVESSRELAGNVGSMKDPRAKRMMEEAIKESGGDLSNPQALRRISEAAMGSSEGTAIMFKLMNKMLPEDVKRETFYDAGGVKSQRGADIISAATGEGGGVIEALESSTSNSKEDQNKLRKDIDKLKKSVKSGHDTTSTPHKVALSIRSNTQKMLNEMQFYYPLMLAAMGAQAVGSLVQMLGGGRAAGGLLKGLVGRSGTTAATTAARTAATTGARTAATTGARATASRAVAQRAVSAGTTRAGTSLALRAGSSGLTKLVGMAGPTAAVLGSLYAGWEVGKLIDKHLGAAVFDSKKDKKLLGKDTSFSNVASIGLASAETALNELFGGSKSDKYDYLKNIKRVRADNSLALENLTKVYDAAKRAVSRHTTGVEPLNKADLAAKKKIIDENEEEVRLHKKWNKEADDLASKNRAKALVGSVGEVRGGRNKEEAIKGINNWFSKGGRNAWMRDAGRKNLDDLLEGNQVEGTSKKESDAALASLKAAADEAGIAWNDYKKLVKERQAVASLKWAAGSYTGDRRKFLEKKTGTDLTGKSENDILDLWARKVSRSEAQVAGLSLPEELRKKAEERNKTNISLTTSTEEENADGTTSIVTHNQVDDSITIVKTQKTNITLDGVAFASAVKNISGKRENTTTNAPGK